MSTSDAIRTELLAIQSTARELLEHLQHAHGPFPPAQATSIFRRLSLCRAGLEAVADLLGEQVDPAGLQGGG